jgi:hypothetical protein
MLPYIQPSYARGESPVLKGHGRGTGVPLGQVDVPQLP